MPRIVAVLASIFIATNAGLVRIPKIYNAVISSDQNLSPSHVIPVVEPVLRTTALGVAFPPIIVQQHPVQQQFVAKTTLDNIPKEQSFYPSLPKKADGSGSSPPQLPYHGSLYPVSFDPYYPYSYTSSDLLFPVLPYYQHPTLVNVNVKQASSDQNDKNVAKEVERPDVVQLSSINFKKNPDVSDVPPPPLPVKSSNSR